MEEPPVVPAPKRLLSGVVPLEAFLTTLQKVCNHVHHCRDESVSGLSVTEGLVWIKFTF